MTTRLTKTDESLEFNIELSEDNFTDSVEIIFKSFNLYREWNPKENFGKEAIEIVLGGYSHKFLVEQRDVGESSKDSNFSVWGRSKNALLGMPYMEPLTDTDDTSYPWQSDEDNPPPVSAKTVLDWCISYYNTNKPSTYPSLSLQYDGDTQTFFENYMIYVENFSISNQTLDQIMDRIIKDFAIMRWDYRDEKIHIRFLLDGNTNWVDAIDDATNFQTYTALDNIIQLSDDRENPGGFNYVIVTGGEDATDSDHSIEMEVDDDTSLNPNTTYTPSENIYIDVYTYPWTMEISTETNKGTFTYVRDVTETITEEVIVFEDRTGSTTKPIYSVVSYEWHGVDLGTVTSTQDTTDLHSESDGCGILIITYVTRYKLYVANSSTVGKMVICATESLEGDGVETIDNETNLAESSLVLDIVAYESELGCTISMELDDSRNGDRSCFAPEEDVYVKLWIPTEYETFMTAGSVESVEQTVTKNVPDPDNDPEDDEWEYINFSNFAGSTSKPIYSITEWHWCGHELGSVLNWHRGYNSLTIDHEDDTEDLGYGVLRIKYVTSYDILKLSMPTAGHDVKLVVYSTDSEYIDSDGNYECISELQIECREDCDPARPKDITLKLVNCVNDNTIQGVLVKIYTGASRLAGTEIFEGYTDADGTIYVGRLPIGTYYTTFEHADYWLNTEDGVVNDSFVVD